MKAELQGDTANPVFVIKNPLIYPKAFLNFAAWGSLHGKL